MNPSSIASHFVGLPGGLLMSMIAFSIVFLVIVGLMLLMMGLKRVAAAITAMNEAKKNAPAAATAAAPAAAPSSAPVAAVASSDDDEVIAVITAAIASICGAGARIVSFRPTPSRMQASPWSMTGRLQNSEGFVD